MTWWRRVFLREQLTETLSLELAAEQSWAPPQAGDRAHGKTYLPGGPPNDPTPQHCGPFPPPGHVDPKPIPGMVATHTDGTVHRRAKIVAVSGREIEARVEYNRRTSIYTRRKDQSWREQGVRAGASRLVLGLSVSNLKSFKKWYTDADIAGGWKLD